MLIAKVAVEGAAYHYDLEYSYITHPGLLPGCRVRVQFGRGEKPATGIALSIEEGQPMPGLKHILEQIDHQPILDGEGLKLLRFLKDQTFCTFFDALRLLIPAGLNVIFEAFYTASPFPVTALDPDKQKIVSYLKEKKAPVCAKQLCGKFKVGEDFLKIMAGDGLIDCLERSRGRILDHKVVMLRLTEGWEDLPLTPKQELAARFLHENNGASLKELCYYTGVTSVVAGNLRKIGAVEFYDRVVPRNPFADNGAEKPPEIPKLSKEQQAAFETLEGCLKNPDKPAFLYGVTGSGKTQVYLNLVEKALSLKKTVIVLVPEISLTAQALESFHQRFGAKVAVLHSGLSLGERLDSWRRIKDGEGQIVVGTRSAIFAPVKNLGLIVMDEEQEHTYKSERSPRYHTRDIARFRAAHHGALLVLASATPSVESYHAAKAGDFTLVTLQKRYGGAALPEVRIVDMRDLNEVTDTPTLSATLRGEILYNLSRGEQSILLLNRRGHSTLVRCSSCAISCGCPSCSVSLTYHTANGALLCHYCGYQKPRDQTCAGCGGKLMRYIGAGTQKLEEELKTAFPGARVLRVDMDTTLAKFSHQKLFAAFAAGDYDIMIGTQMVAKGLNFPRVTLVGVLAADQSLYAGDFRSFEKTFSLLTQVVGRGGRGKLGGRALIQTYSPENPVIQLAASQDYPAFFKDEDYMRKLHLYPPYCKMAEIGFAGMGEEETKKAAAEFLAKFTQTAKENYPGLPLRILGPSPAALARAAGKHRYKLILKCKNNKETRGLLAGLLLWYYKKIKRVAIFIDMHYG